MLQSPEPAQGMREALLVSPDKLTPKLLQTLQEQGLLAHDPAEVEGVGIFLVPSLNSAAGLRYIIANFGSSDTAKA